MKPIRILALSLMLCLTLAFSVSAAEEYVPDSFRTENIDGVQRIVKTYTLTPDIAPGNLWEPSFIYDGFKYTWSYTTTEENPVLVTKEIIEVQTVNTEKDDLALILEALPNQIEYNDGEYSGYLSLDHSSLVTEVSSYTAKSATVSDTKTFTGLASNDMSYIPTSTTKNGTVLPLTNVVWQITATDLVGGDLIPTQYQAVATYSTSYSYQAAEGYVTTAEYKGTVAATGIGSIVYTVVFTGEAITPSETETPVEEPVEQPETTELPERTEVSRHSPVVNLWIILSALFLLLLAVAVLLMFLCRKNIFVYVPGDMPKEYRLIAKFRGSSRCQGIDISDVDPLPQGNVAIEIKRPLVTKLLGKDFTVNCCGQKYTYKVRRDLPSDWHEYNIETLEEVIH